MFFLILVTSSTSAPSPPAPTSPPGPTAPPTTGVSTTSWVGIEVTISTTV